jgi:hypothetical protein
MIDSVTPFISGHTPQHCGDDVHNILQSLSIPEQHLGFQFDLGDFFMLGVYNSLVLRYPRD